MKYTNADVVKPIENDEVVLIFTNPAAAGASFTVPGLTSARILAVGGGGGGGGS